MYAITLSFSDGFSSFTHFPDGKYFFFCMWQYCLYIRTVRVAYWGLIVFIQMSLNWSLFLFEESI